MVCLENVPRLLNSPANARGLNFAIILNDLISMGYEVEWRVINAADYGMYNNAAVCLSSHTGLRDQTRKMNGQKSTVPDLVSQVNHKVQRADA